MSKKPSPGPWKGGAMTKLDQISARDADSTSDGYIRDVLDDRRYLLRLIKDCETALQLIADQTVCPELFTNDTGDKLCVKTAMAIALSTLDKVRL